MPFKINNLSGQKTTTGTVKYKDSKPKTKKDTKKEPAIKPQTKAVPTVLERYGAGNIDLTNRPQYINEDGSVSTVRSIGIQDNGKEVVIPTIATDEKGNAVKLTDEQARQRYYDTGEYLGKFDTREEADNYAQRLHLSQESGTLPIQRGVFPDLDEKSVIKNKIIRNNKEIERLTNNVSGGNNSRPKTSDEQKIYKLRQENAKLTDEYEKLDNPAEYFDRKAHQPGQYEARQYDKAVAQTLPYLDTLKKNIDYFEQNPTAQFRLEDGSIKTGADLAKEARAEYDRVNTQVTDWQSSRDYYKNLSPYEREQLLKSKQFYDTSQKGKEQMETLEKEDAEKVKKVAKKYGINLDNFDYFDFMEWADTNNIGFSKQDREDYNLLSWYVTNKLYDEASQSEALPKTLASIKSIGSNILGGVGQLLPLVYSAATGEDYDMYSDAARNSRLAANIQQNVGAGMSEKGRFYYDTAMSIGQNLALMPLAAIPGAGEWLILGTMGASAAAQKANQLRMQGKSAAEAARMGLVAGGIEAITEKIGLDNLMGLIKKGSKSVILALMRQAGAEGLEEVLADILNLTADAIAYGEDSEYGQTVKAYMNGDMTDGKKMSRAEAERNAFADFCAQTWQSFYGGALSGLVLGGGGMAINAGMTSYKGAQIVNQGGAIGAINEGLGYDVKTDAYKNAEKLTQRMVDNKNVSNFRIGQQAILNTEQAIELVKRNVADDLERYGVNDKNVKDAMTSLLLGEKISGKQAESIAKSKDAISLLEIYTGEDIDTETTISQLKSQIKNIDTSSLIPSLFEYSPEHRISDFAETLGENGKNILTNFYNGEQNAEDYVREMNAVYQAGRNNAAMPATETVNSAQAQAMYQAGQVDTGKVKAYNKSKQTEKGAEKYGKDLRQSGKRNDSGNSGGQVSAMAESARRNAENGRNEVRSQSSGSVTQETEKVETAKSFGIEGGDDRNSVTRVTGDYKGKKEVDIIAKRRGLNVVAFKGNYLSGALNGVNYTARGAIQGGTMYVRVDDPTVSAAQIATHEATHDKIRKKEINLARVKEKAYDASQGQIEILERAYASAYYGIDLETDIPEKVADEIFEEIICDSVAHMNLFEYKIGAKSKATDRFNQMVAWYAGESERAIEKETRGSPEGAKKTAFSFAGTDAQNADKSLLQQARQMQEKGATKEQILKETGWFVGADGKWRFEISDKDMQFFEHGQFKNPDVLRFQELENKFINLDITDEEQQELQALTKKLEGVNKYPETLEDYIKHDKLFEQYPHLAKIKVKFDNLNNYNGKFTPSTNTITINRELKNNTNKLKNTLLHEIQHIIQRYEGFASGTNLAYWQNKNSDDIRFADEEYERWMYNSEIRQNELMWILEKSGFLDYYNDIVLPQYEGKSYSLIPEITDEEYANEIRDWLKTNAPNYLNVFDDASENFFFAEKKYEQAAAKRRKIKSKSPLEMYINTAGEIEARDAANRRSLTEEQRRDTFPESAEENPDRVFVEDGGVSYSIDPNYTFAKQVHDALNGTMERGFSVFAGRTPNLLIKAGLKQAPMLMNQSHLRDINHEKSDENRHFHGIDEDVIVQVPNLIKKPVAIYDSISEDNKENSICVLANKTDKDGNPIIVSITKSSDANKYYTLSLDVVKTKESNYATSMYGKDDFLNHLKDILDKDALLYADKAKVNKVIQKNSQNANSDVKLELLERLDAIGYNKIIHQSRNLVNTYSMENSEKDARTDESSLFADDTKLSRDIELTEEQEREIEKLLNKLEDEYGKIEQGEKPYREVSVPKKTAKDKNVSETVRTILEAKATPDEMLPTIKKLISDGEFSFKTLTDSEAIESAAQKIEQRGWDRTYSEWVSDIRQGKFSKENTALGWALYNNAANSGNTATALDILAYMVKSQRSAAQALQATRILKTLSPESQLYGIVRTIENLQEELNEKYGDGETELVIDPGLAEQFLQETDEFKRDKILKEIYKDIGRQMPSNWIDKFNAWRYMAMLLNPKTHIRNILGNALFMPVVLTKNVVGAGIETIASKAFGMNFERTKGLVKGDLFKSALADYENIEDIALGNGKYDETGVDNNAIQEGRHIFKSKILDALRRFNSFALDKEDVWFSKPHYAIALAQYCAANNISAEQIKKGVGLDRARAYAIKEAQKATYRDINAFSAAVQSLGHARNSDNIFKKGSSYVVEGTLPFKKTPANIFVRGFEYSPAGLLTELGKQGYKMHTLKEALASGKITQEQFNESAYYETANFFDGLAAGLTGSGLMALGAVLAGLGKIRLRGADDEDEKKRKFDKLTGHQKYSMEFGDVSVTLDWLAPEILPFFVGVEIYNAKATENLTMSDIMNIINNISSPMLENSFLQGVNNLFENISYARQNEMNALTTVLTTAATNYFTQFFPTILGNFERVFEDKRMTTFVQRDGFLTRDVQYLLGKVSQKIPYWDYQQMPYIDNWGREQETGNMWSRIVANFLNPSYINTVKESKMEKELLRLYDKTGSGSVFPNKMDFTIKVDGEETVLTQDQYIRFQKYAGTTAYDLITELTADGMYKSLSDADKVKMVSECYSYSKAIASRKINSKYEPESWMVEAYDIQKNTKLPVSKYLLIRAEVNTNYQKGIIGSNGKSVSNSRGLLVMDYINSIIPGNKQAQRRALYEAFDVGKTIIHYNEKKVKEKITEVKRTKKWKR